ncbi:MAG: MerR family transcriptional regulator [Coriobacteriia bacterium]|nr:MerR family transcriptional regulator [Coriobacteriia bacterium]MCL2536687.1 MerR family transcriptional regulator [Coriobacteriia bacterium]
MDESSTYTVGQLAGLAGVTTKTLRHYDRIGLLQPSARSQAGYRLYQEGDARRLAEILAYRALDMPLEQIAGLMDGTHSADCFDRSRRLISHLELLKQERSKIDGLIHHLEDMIYAELEGAPMSTTDELNGFANDPYEDEAREKWGHTDAYAQSARRVKGYTPADWERYKEEAADINHDFVALMNEGEPADGPDARALAEEHRELISRWFYDCSPEMHANFGAMWEADPRFKENIDKAGEGLSDYMATAFRAAAAQQD